MNEVAYLRDAAVQSLAATRAFRTMPSCGKIFSRKFMGNETPWRVCVLARASFYWEKLRRWIR